jgi:hypothetical protein
VCAKDEPFIAQEGHGDINHCGKCEGNACGKPRLRRQKAKKKAKQQKKTAVAKHSVPRANDDIAQQLTARLMISQESFDHELVDCVKN